MRTKASFAKRIRKTHYTYNYESESESATESEQPEETPEPSEIQEQQPIFHQQLTRLEQDAFRDLAAWVGTGRELLEAMAGAFERAAAEAASNQLRAWCVAVALVCQRSLAHRLRLSVRMERQALALRRNASAWLTDLEPPRAPPGDAADRGGRGCSLELSNLPLSWRPGTVAAVADAFGEHTRLRLTTTCPSCSQTPVAQSARLTYADSAAADAAEKGLHMHVFSGSPVRVRRTEPCTRRSGLPQSPQPPLSSPRSAAAAAAAAAVVEGEQLSDKITRLADRQAARIVRGAWSQAGEATREALALRRAALLGQGEQPPRRGGKQRSKPPADALQPEAATWEPLY